MAHIIKIPSFVDERGHLSVIEFLDFPFRPKRLYYIYNVDNSERAKHRHKKTIQALIATSGSCIVETNNNRKKEIFKLNSADKALILEPEDWHIVNSFNNNCVLMVLASEAFDENDYIYQNYS